MPQHVESASASASLHPVDAEPQSLAQLRGDCARMAPHWRASAGASAPASAEPVSPSRIRGVSVPPASAHLVDGMSEYGD